MKPACDPNHFKTFCQLCRSNTQPGMLKPEALDCPLAIGRAPSGRAGHDRADETIGDRLPRRTSPV